MKTWKKPEAAAQQFAANEYVSACTVAVKCDYWPAGVSKREHWQLLVPDTIEGGVPGVDVGAYYEPCATEYTYDVNVSEMKKVVFTKDDWGNSLGGSYSAFYWIEIEENGGKDFHVSSISAAELAAANLS